MSGTKGEIEIIGWHDGITEALLREEDGRWSYASLIAWKPDDGLRIFGLIAVDERTVAEVRGLMASPGASQREKQRAWSAVRRRIAGLLKVEEGEAELRLCDQLDGETKKSLRVHTQEIVAMMGGDVDDALSPERFSILVAKLRREA